MALERGDDDDGDDDVSVIPVGVWFWKGGAVVWFGLGVGGSKDSFVSRFCCCAFYGVGSGEIRLDFILDWMLNWSGFLSIESLLLSACGTATKLGLILLRV